MKGLLHNPFFKNKQPIFFITFTIFILLIFTMIWFTIVNKENQLRKNVTDNQALLIWMKTMDTRILTLKKYSDEINLSSSKKSLLSIIQNQLKNNVLSGQLSELKQTGNDCAQLSFQSINFDDLVNWLIHIEETNSLIVTKLSITSINANGIVNATTELKKTSLA